MTNRCRRLAVRIAAVALLLASHVATARPPIKFEVISKSPRRLWRPASCPPTPDGRCVPVRLEVRFTNQSTIPQRVSLSSEMIFVSILMVDDRFMPRYRIVASDAEENYLLHRPLTTLAPGASVSYAIDEACSEFESCPWPVSGKYRLTYGYHFVGHEKDAFAGELTAAAPVELEVEPAPPPPRRLSGSQIAYATVAALTASSLLRLASRETPSTALPEAP